MNIKKINLSVFNKKKEPEVLKTEQKVAKPAIDLSLFKKVPTQISPEMISVLETPV